MSTAPGPGGDSQLLTALVAASDRIVVRAIGDADIATSPQLAEALAAAATADAQTVVVDLSAVRFWDVSGLHVLAASTARLAAAGRELVLVGATDRTRRLVGLADFTAELHLARAA